MAVAEATSGGPERRGDGASSGPPSPYPGTAWLLAAVRRPLLRDHGCRLLEPTRHSRPAHPGVEPARVGLHGHGERDRPVDQRYLPVGMAAHVRLHRDRHGALRPGRLPGGLLRGSTCPGQARPAARPHPGSLVDQLPHPHARLGRHPRRRGVRQRHRRGSSAFAKVDWLGGQWYVVVIALVYGYLPFFIVPLYAYLDRIDQHLIEASRDLGANTFRTFFRVTLPLSRIGLITAMVITALPMFGDYYTNTLVSNSPTTVMIGNSIEGSIQSGFSRGQGASLVLLLSAVLLFFMAYYLDPDHSGIPGGSMTTIGIDAPGAEKAWDDEGRYVPPPASDQARQEGLRAAVAQPVASPLRARHGHLALHLVEPGAGPDRRPVLVQRLPLTQLMERLHHCVVLLRHRGGVDRRGHVGLRRRRQRRPADWHCRTA